MKKSKEEIPKRKRRKSWFRVALQYIFLWPAIRNYIMLWFKYKPKKKDDKKEKVVIIED